MLYRVEGSHRWGKLSIMASLVSWKPIVQIKGKRQVQQQTEKQLTASRSTHDKERQFGKTDALKARDTLH